RRMLPCTTRFAPRSLPADEGSLILRLRTTLDGTTHNDCCAESRFESLLVSESINPCATASFCGSFPMLSNGSTATCFAPVVRQCCRGAPHPGPAPRLSRKVPPLRVPARAETAAILPREPPPPALRT